VEAREGNVIIYEGAPTEHCYIVDEGMAVAMREGEEHPVKTYAVGHVFGDIGILKSDPSRESVVAKASKRGLCRCVRMSAAVFKEVQTHSDDVALFLHQRTLQVQLELTAAPTAHTSIARNDDADAQQKKRAGYSITVTVAAIRRAFSEHYDKQMPKKEISRLLALGFGHDLEGGDEPDDDATIALQTFMDRLRTTVVPRFSLREELTDRQRREQFLREVSVSERQGIEEVFNHLDASGDGSLDIDELEELLVRIYGMEPTKLQLQHLMAAIDLDGDGEIDIDEFVSAMATVKEVKQAGEIFKWHQLFNRYDADGSGELGQDEVEEMAAKMWGDGHSSTLRMKELMVSEADTDGDGLVSWPEFRTMMMKISGGSNKEELESAGVTPNVDPDGKTTACSFTIEAEAATSAPRSDEQSEAM
jgi:Ca2+-binding EF-hand superfamily protein/CRP-like cAMP-binding protein